MMRPRRPWPGPRSIAHRGGGTLAPENTLAAIRTGIAYGYRGVEFDVMLTADGVPVLMHDPDFGRTIGGIGSVATTSYADLALRDAGSWFGPRYAGEPVPRYDDVVRFCVANDVWMNVEIKPSPGREVETGRVVGEVTAALALRDGLPILFSSFAPAALEAASTAAPNVPRGLLFGALPADAVASARALGCVSVHADHRHLDREEVARLQAAGFAVMVYTVDEPSRARKLLAWGVDAVCTDRIDLMKREPPTL